MIFYLILIDSRIISSNFISQTRCIKKFHLYITRRVLCIQVHIKNCALPAEFSAGPTSITRSLLSSFLETHERGRYVQRRLACECISRLEFLSNFFLLRRPTTRFLFLFFSRTRVRRIIVRVKPGRAVRTACVINRREIEPVFEAMPRGRFARSDKRN